MANFRRVKRNLKKDGTVKWMETKEMGKKNKKQNTKKSTQKVKRTNNSEMWGRCGPRKMEAETQAKGQNEYSP